MDAGKAIRRAAAAIAAAAVLGPAAIAAAGPAEERTGAALSTTGNDSERLRAVPITKQPGEKERVAMSLGPEQLPRFHAGDRLRISAEVQISTTCVTKSARCVGRSYDYNPWVTARLALSGGPSVGDPSIPLGESQQIKCTQRRPQRNHHCTIVFPNFEHAVGDPALLPCVASNQCYVNLIVGAWKRKAKINNRIVLGADRADGSVAGDKGRLNVVEIAPEVPPPGEGADTVLEHPWLPLNEGKKLKRRVVHSVIVPAPRKGEVLTFDGSYTATIDRLPYNVFVSSRVLAADNPLATSSEGLAKSSVQFRGAATEANGFNCTQGNSGFSTPCTARKAGAIRITRDVVDPATGQPVPLYLNLIGSAKPLLYPQQKVKRWQTVKLGVGSGFSVTRYAP